MSTNTIPSFSDFMASQGTATITWKDDGIGEEVSSYSRKRVTTHARAFRDYTYDRANVLANRPKGQRGDAPTFFNGLSALCCARPSLLPQQRQQLNTLIDTRVGEYLNSLNTPQEEAQQSDAEFLTILGNKRDWKSGCAICLTEKIMGTTCTCGHTEIAVFRPCGHTVCMRPCFVEMMEHIGVSLKPQEMKIGDQTFIVGSQRDPSSAPEFECPLCRTTVRRVFQAEQVKVKDLLPQELVDSIVEECLAEVASRL